MNVWLRSRWDMWLPAELICDQATVMLYSKVWGGSRCIAMQKIKSSFLNQWADDGNISLIWMQNQVLITLNYLSKQIKSKLHEQM